MHINFIERMYKLHFFLIVKVTKCAGNSLDRTGRVIHIFL